MTTSRRVEMLCVAVLLAVAGCSEDGGSDDTGVGTDSGGAEEATCAPVFEDLEDTAAETVPVQLDDAFGPSRWR